MFGKGENTSITFDRKGFVEGLRQFFNSEANAYYATRGELEARAIYLLHLDLYGEASTKELIEILRLEARKKGEPFNEQIFLSSEDWGQYVLGQLETLKKDSKINDEAYYLK